MKRTSSFGNSTGTVTVTIEGYGAKKHELGDDEFGEWLDHQSDFTSLVLSGVMAGLKPASTGSRTARTSFEVEQDGTHVVTLIELKLWKSVDPDAIDRLMDGLAMGIKTHVRMHLKPAFDDSAFESWSRMDPSESPSDLFSNMKGSGGKGPLAGLLSMLLQMDDNPLSGLRLDLMDDPASRSFWGDYGYGGFPTGRG